MIRRDLINQLLDGDMGEEIFIYITDGEHYASTLTIDYVDNDTIMLNENIPEVICDN